MEEKIFNLKMSMPYLQNASLKEKEIQMLIHIINQSKLNDNIKFYKYVNLSYEDEKREFPLPKLYDTYKRGKINCISFVQKTLDKYKYNYFFIYQTSTDDSGNDKDDKCHHIYGINCNKTNLIRYLSRMVKRID